MLFNKRFHFLITITRFLLFLLLSFVTLYSQINQDKDSTTIPIGIYKSFKEFYSQKPSINSGKREKNQIQKNW